MSTDLLLVCSSGGHLAELHALEPFWSAYSRTWVTFDKVDATTLLRGERVRFAYGPTNRNLVNLVRNFFLAWKILREERPRVIVSSGAGIAIPFFVLGRLLAGARLVFLESFARFGRPSLTGRVLYPVVDKFLVQWPEVRRFCPRAEFWGRAV